MKEQLLFQFPLHRFNVFNFISEFLTVELINK